MIVLEPVSGQTMLATRYDRHVLLIHGGTPEPKSGLLYATNGSIRMYDDDLRHLIAKVRGELSVKCGIEVTNISAISTRVTLDPQYDEGDPPPISTELISGGAKHIVCATSQTSGVRHRYRVLQQVRRFAQMSGYSMRMLWGVTSGVSYCRHEDLFEDVPGVDIENISEEELRNLSGQVRAGKVLYKWETLHALAPRETPVDRFFAWDCEIAEALGKRIPLPAAPLIAKLCPSLQAQADDYGRQIGVRDRLGIRVRVTESANDHRRPHRIKSELDATLAALYMIPSRTPVFIATDSEYVQQCLTAHFEDFRIVPKQFEQQEATGRYIHRIDKEALSMFLIEVDCLCSCRQVINIGGFLNDSQIYSKLIREPYRETSPCDLRAPISSGWPAKALLEESLK